MTRRRRFALAAVGLLAVGGIAAGLFAWLRPAAPARPDVGLFRTLRTVTAAIAMTEKPDAVRVAFGEEAGTYREFFERAGYACAPSNVTEGAYDIVMLRGTKAAADLPRQLGRLTANGIAVLCLPTAKMSVAEFGRVLERVGANDAHLWMPGAEEWMLVVRRRGAALKLDAMLDVFTRERSFEDFVAAGCDTLPRVFASYVGTVGEIRPALAALDGGAEVRPELFLPEKVQGAEWIVRGGTDPEIAALVDAEISTNQVARRVALEGTILSRKGEVDKALDTWAAAYRINPADPMMLERIERLEVNAHTFYRVGNLPMAVQCYEALVIINPENLGAMRRLGLCYRQSGRRELGDEVLRKADAGTMKKVRDGSLR